MDITETPSAAQLSKDRFGDDGSTNTRGTVELETPRAEPRAGNDAHASEVLIPFQPRIAVYTKPFDEIVIRQEAMNYDVDVLIMVRRKNVQALVLALIAARDGKR
jgi:hypothetical protein